MLAAGSVVSVEEADDDTRCQHQTSIHGVINAAIRFRFDGSNLVRVFSYYIHCVIRRSAVNDNVLHMMKPE